ncbi:MAG: nuclear transport factor 2 family protein [Gammaproteobacteria bacterium]|nr:nuclear transport factor 2 family protein [Gammaproteobacteria bacterium]
MSANFKNTWEIYVAAWKAASAAEKHALFKACLDSACVYTDPLIKTQGWEALQAYMLDFHRQIPGGHFVTTYFLAHNHKSIAQWQMRNADNTVLGVGMSYAEYNDTGKLVAMTGFFEPPGG